MSVTWGTAATRQPLASLALTGFRPASQEGGSLLRTTNPAISTWDPSSPTSQPERRLWTPVQLVLPHFIQVSLLTRHLVSDVLPNHSRGNTPLPPPPAPLSILVPYLSFLSGTCYYLTSCLGDSKYVSRETRAHMHPTVSPVRFTLYVLRVQSSEHLACNRCSINVC